MAVSDPSETVEVTVFKHPYQHPYGIAPCVPQRLMERKSLQVGTVGSASSSSVRGWSRPRPRAVGCSPSPDG